MPASMLAPGHNGPETPKPANMKFIIPLILVLTGCAHKSGLRLNEHGLGPSDADFIELMFKEVKYDGTTLDGQIELHALDDIEIPNILNWRTLILDRAWTCDTFDDVDLSEVDYATSPDTWQGVLRLRKGDFYGRHMKFYVSPQAPDCIRFEVLYAPDGQFRGHHTTKVKGMAKREPPSQPTSP
ncbi:hypothetical protein ASNO1_23340 [Corallococcus caeni]|uniref:Lipoprotein n=2 Tax=Corallococcus caeni TaxID=3082388 RepID=A0ABQ6QQE5_9BACT|nr:hypothetical protein ASNO1_23340 [Corallococcus sp. NO1]